MTRASSSPCIVGLGELLWDDFPDARRPGGAPANVAFHAAQLGCRGVVASRVGSDPAGSELVTWLHRQGVDTSAIQVDLQRPTGRVTVHFSPEGQPQYHIHENVAWDFLGATEGMAALMSSAAAVCYGTLAQRCEHSRNAIHTLLNQCSPDCLRVYDVNLRQNLFQREWIEDSLRLARIVKLNHEEVPTLAGLLDLPGEPTAFANEMLRRYGPEAVVITRAADGCLAVSSQETVDLPGIAVQIADPVGAGDAFTAGLIWSRLQGWPLAQCTEFANRMGALVAARSGAMPEMRPEYQQLTAAFAGN